MVFIVHTFAIWWFAVFSMLILPTKAERTCNITIIRVTGTSNLFALGCQCESAPEFLGRAVRFLDADIPNSVAQEEVTVDCLEHRIAGLASICARDVLEYERQAAQVLEECLSKRPTNPTAEGMMPFTFNAEGCRTEFRELDAERLEVLLVCGCPRRPGYIVSAGVTQFVTVGSPIGGSEEQRSLQMCTAEAMIQLNDACRNTPERFELRAAQAFNVCCKRARVLFDNEKLLCQATVPDDISQIGLTFAG